VQPGDQAIEPGRQENQVATGLYGHPVGVRRAGGHEDGGASGRVDLPVGEAEAERSPEHVPGFVAGAVRRQIDVVEREQRMVVGRELLVENVEDGAKTLPDVSATAWPAASLESAGA
jgi:hypothetical protein